MPSDIAPPFELDSLRFDAQGLVPVVAQDVSNREVLMLAHANREALSLTLETRLAHYWSRSRQKLWQKGEESGHLQHVQGVMLDCDGDAVLYLVDQTGPACHKLERSCFHNALLPTEPSKPRIGEVIELVYATVAKHIRTQPEGSYVAKMHNAGLDRILKKIGEEAGEVIIAAKNQAKPELQLEAADLVFHTLFVMAELGVTPEDLAGELAARHGKRRA